MNWHGKNVLVTGSAGFLGSHLAEKLVSLGARTRCMVHYNSSGSHGWLDHSPLKKEFEIYAGDICDPDSVHRGMKDIEIVYHLAALIGIPYSYGAPRSYVRTNIEGTLNVVQEARTVGVEYLVHTSTSEVYGTASYVPIDENHPLKAQSPYSASKIAADKIVESFHRSFGLSAVTIRPFNTFGPRQSMRAVLPTIISQCLAADTLHLGNLYATRDLNYVMDMVEGFVLCATPQAVGQVINIGSGQEISIGELAKLVAKLTGRSIKIERDEKRVRPKESEVDRLLADNSRALNLIGWQPRFLLANGLQLTIDWMRDNMKHYRWDEYSL